MVQHERRPARIMPHKQTCPLCRQPARYTPSLVSDLWPTIMHKVSLGWRRTQETYLLDIRDLRSEALRDLGDYLLDKWLILHRLPGFHDPR